MPHIRYRISMISVAALTAFAKETGEDVFSYTLNKVETDSVVMRNGTPLQDDNAVFFQTMCIIKGEEYTQVISENCTTVFPIWSVRTATGGMHGIFTMP